MPTAAARRRTRDNRRRAAAVTIGLIVCVALLAAAGAWVKQQFTATPLPMAERCVVTDGSASTELTPEQAQNAALITGVATQRGLSSRAATIALATALQESGLRNLDWGDRDSVGLFQQRPSQGWGTEAELMDRYYASNAFYAALVKVDDWDTGDVNDVAQAVQRSGVPDGYRKHVSRATLIAGVLSGDGGTIRCVDKHPQPGNAAGYVDLLEKTYGFTAVTVAGQRVSFDTRTPEGARALGYLAVANTHDLGVTSVQVGDSRVTTSTATPLPWASATPSAADTHVEVTFR